MKPFYKSWTFWTAVGQILIAIGTFLTTTNPTLDTVAIVTLAKSVWDIYLRFKTNTPLQKPKFLE